MRKSVIPSYCRYRNMLLFNRDLSREFRIPISTSSPSAQEIHFQKEFLEGNLLFIPPNIIISWVRRVSTNTGNW